MLWTSGRLTDRGGSARTTFAAQGTGSTEAPQQPREGPVRNGQPENGEGHREDLGTGTNIASHGKPWGDMSLLSFELGDTE